MNIDLGPDDWRVASMQDAVIGLYTVGVVRLPSLESTTCINQCIAMQLFSHEFSHSEYFVQSEAVVLSMQSSTQAAVPARLVVEVQSFQSISD